MTRRNSSLGTHVLTWMIASDREVLPLKIVVIARIGPRGTFFYLMASDIINMYVDSGTPAENGTTGSPNRPLPTPSRSGARGSADPAPGARLLTL